MHTRHILSIVSVASLALTAAALPVSGAYVQNGSFETAGAAAGNSANWLELPSTGTNTVARVNSNASVGSFAEQLTALGQAGIGTGATLQQITSQTTPAGDAPATGATYTLNFDVKPITFVGTNLNYQFGFFVPGTGVTAIANGDRNNLVAGSGYQTLTLESQAAPAGATGFYIQFTAAAGADPSLKGDMFIDNVRVSSSVPEPASLSVLALSGLTLIRRRRA